MRGRQHVRREKVSRRHRPIGCQLQNLALEHLYAAAEQRELVRNRVAERAHGAAVLEIIEDGWRVDSVARGREESRVERWSDRLSRRQRRLGEDAPEHERDTHGGGQRPVANPPHRPP